MCACTAARWLLSFNISGSACLLISMLKDYGIAGFPILEMLDLLAALPR